MKKILTLLLVVIFFFSCKKENTVPQSLDNITKTITFNIKTGEAGSNIDAIVTLQIISENHTGGTGDRTVWDTVFARQKVKDFQPITIQRSITTGAVTILSAGYSIDYYSGDEFFWATSSSKKIFQNSREGQVDIDVSSF